MNFNLTVTRKARLEALEALTYYDSIQPGLGDNFLTDLEERINTICENPYLYSYIDNKMVLRDTILKRFPYLIIFKIRSTRVIIVAIRNRHKKPFSASH